MRLWQVRRHWDELAKADPLWAVLTETGKEGKRWSAEEFYSTGVAEVAADLARVRVLAPDFRGRRALDFGCGAGRLTQALAAHFDRVTGVDISGRMVALARSHNRNERVTFVQNRKPDLRDFASGSFDFVYSRITLQHIAPRYSRRYLREFVRVLAPGGILFVQIPAGVPPGDPPDRFRLSLWPPTVWMRLRRYIRYHYPGWFPGTPKMQMYALGRDEVAGGLAAAGAAVISVEQGAHGAFEDLCYVAKTPLGPSNGRTR